MFIESFSCGPIATNALVVACTASKVAAIVDAPPMSLKTLAKCLESQQFDLKMLLLTHSHWDHTGNAAAIKKRYSVPIYVHETDAQNVREPGSDGLPQFFPVDAVEPDHLLAGGEIIELGTLRFEVIHTPGHTPGGVCFYEKNHQVLLAGDTLFQGSIGRLDLPTGDAEAMWPSLETLSKLPPETKVYPGHGATTTIGAEGWLSQARRHFG